MSVIVYSAPDCQACKATYRKLDEHGFEYSVIDATEDADARETVIALGYSRAPVVVTERGHWGGYRPDEIERVAKELMDELHAERAARYDEH